MTAAVDDEWARTSSLRRAYSFDLPETSPPPRGAADYLRYTISVTAGEYSHTVHLTDPIEDPDVQALVESLEAKARESRTPQ